MVALNILDLNDNGVLGLPDGLGWLFFGTVGLLGLAVCVGVVLMVLALLGHGAKAAAEKVAEVALPENDAADHSTPATASARDASSGRPHEAGR